MVQYSNDNTQDYTATGEVVPTMSSDKEMPVEQTTLKADENQTTEQKEPEIERAKKGRISFRRKKKKSKASIPEPDNSLQDKQQEIPPERDESPPKTAMNSELQTSGENLSQSDETTEVIDGKEKKKDPENEKVSRTKKFKRWASFSAKQKKEDAENKSSETKHKSKGAKIKRVSSDSNLMKDIKQNNGNVNNRGESQLSKDERRKRSVSFAEKVEYNDDDLVAVVETRTRSTSFSEDTTIESLDVACNVQTEQEKTIDEPNEDLHENIEQDQTAETAEVEENITAPEESSKTENNEQIVNKDSPEKNIEEDKDVESLSDVNDKTDDEYTTAGDMTAEEDNTEIKPKMKKKKFLRKLSSRNIKRKDNKSLTKDDISSPLELLDSESTVNDGEQSEPEEHAKEKDKKRKKSVFGLKLPKPLKKRKSSSNEQQSNVTERNIEKKTDNEDKNEKKTAGTENLIEGQQTENIESQNDNIVDKEQSEQCETLVSLQDGHDDKQDGSNDDISTLNKSEQIEEPVKDNNDENNIVDDKQDGRNDEISTSNEQMEESVKENNENQPETKESKHVEEDGPVQSSTPSDMNQSEWNENIDEEEKIEDKVEENNPTQEYNDDLNDSSLSVSEITMIELGDESSLLAIPVIQENAQQPDIHELSSCATPEITLDEITQETEVTQVNESTQEETQEHVVTPEKEVTQEDEVTPETEVTQEDDVTPESEVAEQDENDKQGVTPEDPISETNEEKLSDSSEITKDETNVTRPLSPEVCNGVRGFEMSVRTKTMVDSYILIDQQLEVSQDFLRQVELMNNRKNRCFVM